MATEVTWVNKASGRLPGLAGSAVTVPSTGLKIRIGKFTIGTAEYPVGGYTAADLEGILGLTRIVAILPMGVLTVPGATTLGFAVSWDGENRKLQVFGNIDADTGNATAGAEAAMVEMGSNDASIDGGIVYAVVIGY